MLSRRNTLAVLGLTTASLGTEAVAQTRECDTPRPVLRCDVTKFVEKLRAFADAVERREFRVREMQVSSRLSRDEVAVNTITIEFLNVGETV